MGSNTDNRHTTRQLPEQEIHYLRMTVNYNDANIANGNPFAAYLPAGAQIVFATVNILTAFNAGTTNVLTVGQNSSTYNDIVSAADINPGATGSSFVLRGADLNLSSGDVLPYVKYTQSGTAASAGQAVIVIAYIPNNDL